MQQPNQSNVNPQFNKNSSLEGKEAFQKNQQSQKFNASNAKEKGAESYVPNKKKVEEDEIDSDSSLSEE